MSWQLLHPSQSATLRLGYAQPRKISGTARRSENGMLPVLYNLSSIFSLHAKACLIVLTETKRAVATATALLQNAEVFLIRRATGKLARLAESGAAACRRHHCGLC